MDVDSLHDFQQDIQQELQEELRLPFDTWTWLKSKRSSEQNAANDKNDKRRDNFYCSKYV